mmetsp:Transcript_9256/g.28810  ORF Transcript_9256/g.28810 Transcript_9256/m.28810 type:complete len:227 (-) Transcript_9256:1396-2076(-)
MEPNTGAALDCTRGFLVGGASTSSPSCAESLLFPPPPSAAIAGVWPSIVALSCSAAISALVAFLPCCTVAAAAARRVSTGTFASSCSTCGTSTSLMDEPRGAAPPTEPATPTLAATTPAEGISTAAPLSLAPATPPVLSLALSTSMLSILFEVKGTGSELPLATTLRTCASALLMRSRAIVSSETGSGYVTPSSTPAASRVAVSVSDGRCRHTVGRRHSSGTQRRT